MRYVQNWAFRRVLNPLSPDWLNRMVERRWRRVIAERIAGYYAESNRATSRLIGRDLAAFGYEVAAAATEHQRVPTYPAAASARG